MVLTTSHLVHGCSQEEHQQQGADGRAHVRCPVVDVHEAHLRKLELNEARNGITCPWLMRQPCVGS